MSHLDEIQEWLRSSSLAGIVIPSTDEFLSEFSPAPNRRLRWATGFRGSTGMAVILRHAAALFLDSRYVLQATEDVEGAPIAIEPAGLPARRTWLQRELPPGSRLGLNPWLHSTVEIGQWRSLAAELGLDLDLLPDHPVDKLWSVSRPPEHRPLIVDYPVCYAGVSHQAKCAALVEYMTAKNLEAFLLADPEDVSWLLNVRAGDAALRTEVGEWHVVPSCTSRALLWRDGTVTWFVEKERLAPELAARSNSFIRIAPVDALADEILRAARCGWIGADLRRTPAALTLAVELQGKLRDDDAVARRRWRKHVTEVQSARRTHILDAAAVVRFAAWLKREIHARDITEFEAAQALEAFRAENPDYKGPSMPLMSASGSSGAQPHYVPRRTGSRKLNDHPIYWMDSGGQYAGGTTDNTIALALSEPDQRHVLAHTLVLQGFIALATACVPAGTYALRIDTIARQALWREGMDYPHGTGHGVGNYLNIHEGPLFGREPGAISTVPVEPGMILSNEPGYYAPGDFGLRIESHMVAVESRHPDFVEFETISRLPIDPALVDFGRLSAAERQWLATYHEAVLRDLEPLLDAPAATWLRSVVRAYTDPAQR